MPNPTLTATPTPTPTESSTGTPTPTLTPYTSEAPNHMSQTIVYGIVAAFIATVSVVVVLVLKKRRNTQPSAPNKENDLNS